MTIHGVSLQFPFAPQALGVAGERLLALFPNNIDRNYPSRRPMGATTAHRFEGQSIPPLLLIAPEELTSKLSFYDLPVEPMQTERFVHFANQSYGHFMGAAMFISNRNLPYLENYLLIVKPNGKIIFICDDHQHVAYGLALARAAGIIDEQINLFHVDEHFDNALNSRLIAKIGGRSATPPPLPVIAALCQRDLGIDHHLSFMDHCGLVEKNRIYYVLSKNLAGLAPEEPPPENDKPRLPKTNIILPGQAPVLARQLGNSVLDLDLDFFAFLHDRLVIEADKERLSEVTEEETVSIVTALAREAKVILIATSPDFFEVEESKIRGLIQTIVAAA